MKVSPLPDRLDPALEKLVRSIGPLNRIHNGSDLEESCEQLAAYMAGGRGEAIIHRYPPGAEHNGWIVPERWHLDTFDLTGPDGLSVPGVPEHPLSVAPYSESVDVELSLEELLVHVETSPHRPDAVCFNFGLMYRHWDSSWRISLPERVVERLERGTYRVRIESRRTRDAMPVLEYRLDGRSPTTIVLVAHLDHPGMVNDSISGCIGSLQAMRALEEAVPTTRLSYSVLLVPELVGSAVHLAHSPELSANAELALCMNMTSHEAPVAFCRSKSASSALDLAIEQTLLEEGIRHVAADSGTHPDCGDEVCLDTVGLRIPTPTLSRIGDEYSAYHTSDDTVEAFLNPGAQERHQEIVRIAYEALMKVERDVALVPTFTGAPCLSNPVYDLYLGSSNVNNVLVESNGMVDLDGRLVNRRKFVEFFLHGVDSGRSALEIAWASRLPFAFVEEYAQAFVERGLGQEREPQRRNLLPWKPRVALA